MTILGILGEANKLEPEESRTIARRVIKRSRVPVIVGASSPSFAAMRSLAQEAMDAGEADVMLAPASPRAPAPAHGSLAQFQKKACSSYS